MSEKAIETKTKEIVDENGKVVERVIETYQEVVPMELKTRKIEKISYAPVVTESVENYEDGKLVATNDVTQMVQTEPKGLDEMKTRITGTSKPVLDYFLYFVIIGLVVAIAFKMFG